MSRGPVNCIVAAVMINALVCLAFGADKSEKYQAYLSPMPHNDAMHVNFSGKGSAVATLEGEALTLSGTFAGLASAATKAHLCLSQAAGIPGKPIFEITVPQTANGKLTATFKFDKSQIEALQKGQLYLQIDSEKAPGGNLWGWLLTEHEVPGPDVPQKGPWFQPEFAVKTK
jgi:hypothetical protein